MKLQLQNVTRRFGAFLAVDSVNLEVPHGELVTLLGPSGSGKTTLLRILAGLDFPDEGQVLFDGNDATHVTARARHVGFVFQHYALFRHMTVFENVAFGLRVLPRRVRPGEAEIRQRVRSLLELVQLTGHASQRPAQLSGGQRQRVALARALAVQPRVLLLDEPFGALDARVRQELRRWLRRLHESIEVTTVLVTHDQQEALEVADRVVVMNRGRIEQVGTPSEVCNQPVNAFVMSFMGSVNVFPGRVEQGKAVVGPWTLEYPEHTGDEAVEAEGYSRPHDLEIQTVEEGDGIWAVVRHVYPTGPAVRVHLDHPMQGAIEVETTPEHFSSLNANPGDRVFVRPRRMRVFVRGKGE